jgi:predicted metal-dependent phosphoesterase TrpH
VRSALPIAALVLLVINGFVAATVATTASPDEPEATRVLQATVRHGQRTLELPFDVPPGVRRLQLTFTRAPGVEAGVGLFDERGAASGSPGQRGVAGDAPNDTVLELGGPRPTPGLVAGPIRPGRWTVVVAVFDARRPAPVRAVVRMWRGGDARAARPAPVRAADPVRQGRRWWWADLHVHTDASSDAREHGGARSPQAVATDAQAAGLDAAALTDHNATGQNRGLPAAAAGTGVLLLGGEEATDWWHGHTTVSGLAPGAWLDFRTVPRPLALRRHETRIDAVLAAARRAGGYTAAAHPLHRTMPWRFLDEVVEHPGARPDGLEVWNGPWDRTDQAAVDAWDELLRRGVRVTASGGSDVHGRRDDGGVRLGRPATGVLAGRLTREALVAGLRAGRVLVSREPGGPEVVVEGRDRAGRWQPPGSTVAGERVRVSVRRAAGLRLVVLRDGRPVLTREVDRDGRLELPAPGRGYVRAELRDGGRMAALVNPVFLAGP